MIIFIKQNMKLIILVIQINKDTVDHLWKPIDRILKTIEGIQKKIN